MRNSHPSRSKSRSSWHFQLTEQQQHPVRLPHPAQVAVRPPQDPYSTLCSPILDASATFLPCSRHIPSNRRANSQQPNSGTQATATERWIRLILAYACHRRLFVLQAKTAGNDWDEVLRSKQIKCMLPLVLGLLLLIAWPSTGYLCTCPSSSPPWWQINRRHMSPFSNHVRSCCIGGCQRNGWKPPTLRRAPRPGVAILTLCARHHQQGSQTQY